MSADRVPSGTPPTPRPVQYHYACETCGSKTVSTDPTLTTCTVPMVDGRPYVAAGPLMGLPKCGAELEAPWAYLDELDAAGLLRSPDPVRPPAYSFNALSEILSLREQVAQLRQWQAETLQVLDGWDRVWTTASRRSRRGESKSDVVLREITRLQAEVGKEDDNGRSDRASLERRGQEPRVSPGSEATSGKGVADPVPGAGSEVRANPDELAAGGLSDTQNPAGPSLRTRIIEVLRSSAREYEEHAEGEVYEFFDTPEDLAGVLAEALAAGGEP